MMLIRGLLYIYIILVLMDSILSFFPQFDRELWRKKLKEIADYSLNHIRKRLPPHLPLDFSPLILIALIQLIIFLW